MKRRDMILGSLIALPLLSVGMAMPGELDPAGRPVDPWDGALKIDIKAGKGNFTPSGSFELNVTVTNVSKQPRKFMVMSCSWPEHWQSDSKLLSVQPAICYRNGPGEIVLASDDRYARVLTIAIAKEAPAGELAFKMAFTPREPKATLWSAPIKIELKAKP